MTAAATPPASSASAPAPETCSTSSSCTPTANPATSSPGICSTLRRVDGSDSHDGLDPNFPGDWRKAARDAAFQQAQNDERDRVYFNPAVRQGKADGLRVLGQFAYYDAIVMHGDGGDATSFSSIRRRALRQAKPPAQGGDETTYLNAFLDARVWAMRQEEAHSDTSRVDTAQRVFLRQGNFDLNPPLDWKVYGDSYHIG